MKDNKINIFGGGILGCLLALELSKKYQARVSIYEKSDDVVNAWHSIKLGGIKVNPGNHAIEMPRALRTIEILQRHIGRKVFRKISHDTKVSIDSVNYGFGDSVNDLPMHLKYQYKNLLENLGTNFSDVDVLNNLNVHGSEFFESFKLCCQRYGDSLKDCWSQFYPWFFPRDFEFASNNEGGQFYNKLRSKNIEGYFLVAVNGLFEEFCRLIKRSLLENNVKLNLGQEINSEFILGKKVSTNIWCAPAFSLFDGNLDFRQYVKNERLLFLGLYKVSQKDSGSRETKIYTQPKEILCINKNTPSLAKLSFLNFNDAVYVLAECFFRDVGEDKIEFWHLVSEEIKKITGYPNNFVEQKFLRKVYKLEDKKFSEVQNKAELTAKRLDLKVPIFSWGPINIARVGPLIDHFSASLDI